MGCGSSTGGNDPSGYKEDAEFMAEARRKRRAYDKKKGFAVECGEDDVPDHDECYDEDPLFEEQDAGSQEFMAVRPWIGQIAEPDSHNPHDPS